MLYLSPADMLTRYSEANIAREEKRRETSNGVGTAKRQKMKAPTETQVVVGTLRLALPRDRVANASPRSIDRSMAFGLRRYLTDVSAPLDRSIGRWPSAFVLPHSRLVIDDASLQMSRPQVASARRRELEVDRLVVRRRGRRRRRGVEQVDRQAERLVNLLESGLRLEEVGLLAVLDRSHLGERHRTTLVDEGTLFHVNFEFSFAGCSTTCYTHTR